MAAELLYYRQATSRSIARSVDRGIANHLDIGKRLPFLYRPKSLRLSPMISGVKASPNSRKLL
jgi:hypothetical protein